MRSTVRKADDDDDNRAGDAEIGMIASQHSFNDKLDFQNPLKNESTPVYSAAFRIGILALLCIQNSGHALLTRYSQGILKEKYSATEVVFVGEMIKLVFSGYFVLNSNDEADIAMGNGLRRLLYLIRHSQSIIILVVLYSIGNVMSYFALGKVEVSVYTVLSQLKILTTAGFSIVFLQRQFSITKWRALLLLIIGCILTASPSFNKAVDCSLHPSLHEEAEKRDVLQSLVGITSVIVMCLISGYASVYFEGMLKKSDVKLGVWHRNFQLAFFSVLFLYCVILYEFYSSNTAPQASYPVMFQGWTKTAVLITLVQSGGGLLVAATLKFADSILKTLATSGAIFLSAVLGRVLLNGQLDMFVALGGFTTIIAIFNYSFDATP